MVAFFDEKMGQGLPRARQDGRPRPRQQRARAGARPQLVRRRPRARAEAEGDRHASSSRTCMRLFEDNQFDTIYHEHFSYFSLLSIEAIFARHGLAVFDVEELWTHGGSLRIYARHAADDARPATERLVALRAREHEAGLQAHRDVQALRGARARDEAQAPRAAHRREARAASGSRATARPARATRCSTTAASAPTSIDFTVDRNPYKHGRFLPGTHIPILPPAHIDEARPDYIFILPWNLKDEIMAQLAHARNWGAKFIVPIPDAHGPLMHAGRARGPHERRPLRILCLGAHSDDIEIGCGGTVLRLLAERPGSSVHWAVLSSNARARARGAGERPGVPGRRGARRASRSRQFRESFFPAQSGRTSRSSSRRRSVSSARTSSSPTTGTTSTRTTAVVAELTWNTFRNHLILEYEIPKYEGDLGAPERLRPAAAGGRGPQGGAHRAPLRLAGLAHVVPAGHVPRPHERARCRVQRARGARRGLSRAQDRGLNGRRELRRRQGRTRRSP